MSFLANALSSAWYKDAQWLHLLSPLEALFKRVAKRRRDEYLTDSRPIYRAPVPVLVVGNISVGGVGKTPLTLFLVKFLHHHGYKPGIVSRGYRSKVNYPCEVDPGASAKEMGDEPLMLAQRADCPVIIDPDRPRGIKYLLEKHPECSVIISDDGLQHYAMARDLEIVVVDGSRGLGNRRCLPVGPLREPPERLDDVDWVLINGENQTDIPGFSMTIEPLLLVNLATGESASLASWQGREVNAVAGIGNPARFFAFLNELGIETHEQPFGDHHDFKPSDIHFKNHLPVIMTEKDAVKCKAFAGPECWYLRIDAHPDPEFCDQLLTRLQEVKVQSAS